MSTGEYFSPVDPDDYSNAARLPESFLPQTLEGMVPGEIIHVESTPDCITANMLGEVFLNMDYSFDQQDATHPDYESGNYVAIMRVYKEGISGFIVDVRSVSAGEIMIVPENAMEFSGEMAVSLGRRSSVLGVVCYDDEYRPYYGSKFRKETINEAQFLAEAVDKCGVVNTKAINTAGSTPEAAGSHDKQVESGQQGGEGRKDTAAHQSDVDEKQE